MNNLQQLMLARAMFRVKWLPNEPGLGGCPMSLSSKLGDIPVVNHQNCED
jgi:hypothetical protein